MSNNPNPIVVISNNFKIQYMKKENDPVDFSDITNTSKQSGFLSEFASMLMHNKKWWLTPIVLVLILFGLLIILGGSSYAPFIYTLF